MRDRLLSPRAGAILLLLAAGRFVAFAETISGEIVADRTLSGVNSVEGLVVVRAGVVLTITAGTTMLMKAGSGFEIRGQLLADGTGIAPILFTRDAPGVRWERLTFVRATSSRLRHCIVEYADCTGSHLDYYDNDCTPSTAPPARTYHEAVVVLASHVDFERCTFRNLPDDGASAEGDALAVISDDPISPGAASAHFDGCQFLSIGQGVHTRFSHVLVENCFFTGHRGDNDDIDMYGESVPPPLIRNNVFTSPEHDDMINPTRCSAIIVGNIISGGDDHGIVLRDRCSPIVMNNLIFNCVAAGISVQNQCDALLVNNTIVNCGRGVRFFDHDTRWGPPYCLSPGSGRATLINNIIWNCPQSLTLADSPFNGDRGSHASVYSCNIQGGQGSTTVSANSRLTWGAGNISVDPQFATNTHRPRAGSPMIDAGISPSTIAPTLTAIPSVDLDGSPRPLDGNGDGSATYDLGAYEFLLATADSNGDGIPDGWLQQYRLSPIDPSVAAGDPDGDSFDTLREWIADTNPTDPRSVFRVLSISGGPPVRVQFQSSANRRYTLYYSNDLVTEIQPGTVWAPVPGQIDVSGTGALQNLIDNASVPQRFYQVSVRIPPNPAPVSQKAPRKRHRSK